jgi:tRNA(Ile2) C34 agmatinyltransferase TiaS
VTPAVLDRPGSVTERPLLGGGGTLEELLSAKLAEAQATGSTECPVCRARMTSTRAGAGAGAECGNCGSRLS